MKNSINNAELASAAYAIEKELGEFVTLHTRPISTVDNGAMPDVEAQLGKVCFVLQGPIAEENDFTVQTVALYRKIFPTVLLIVSTWKDASQSVVERLRAHGALVFQSEKPIDPGPGNINLQIISTRTGLEIAKTQRIDYILKTRTDIRIHASDFLIHACDLLELFPLGDVAKLVQKRRLLSISGGNKYLLNFVPDLNMFGRFEDMEKYWSAKEDVRGDAPALRKIQDMAKYGLSEAYLFNSYCTKLGLENDFSLEGYWCILRDYFIVMDWFSADVYWMRHNRYRENKNIHYYGPNTYENFGFKDWLRLYSGTCPFKVHLEIVNREPGMFIRDLLYPF